MLSFNFFVASLKNQGKPEAVISFCYIGVILHVIILFTIYSFENKYSLSYLCISAIVLSTKEVSVNDTRWYTQSWSLKMARKYKLSGQLYSLLLNYNQE
jgi:hypothetical protein